MTEVQTTDSGQLYNQAGVINKVVPKRTVYMRNHEAVEFEKELETSRLNAENAALTSKEVVQPSEPKVTSGNPTSANEPPASTDWQKRYSDLQSDRDTKIAAAKAETAKVTQEKLELENKLKESQKATTRYPTSEQELEQWCKEFPPLVPIIQTLAIKVFENEKSELVEEMKELKKFQKTYANEKGRAELLKIHPDANEVEADSRFAQWFNEQEPEIQQLVSTGDPKKIGKAITIYKKDLGIVTKTAQELKKEASTAVTLGPTPPNLPKEQRTWHESEVQKMTNKQYAQYEPEIEKARSEGRFVYDISRAS